MSLDWRYGTCERPARRERHDALLEVRERLVDVHGLALGRIVDRAPGLGLVIDVDLFQALAPGQVDQVELGVDHLFRAAEPRALLEVDRKDAVRPVARSVEHVLCRRAHLGAAEQAVEYVLLRVAGRDGEVFNVHAHAAVAVLADLPVLRLARLLAKQVEDALVVQLEVRAAHLVLVLGARVDLLEQVRDGARDAAALVVLREVAQHRKRLARARLPVRKDGAVRAVRRALHDRAAARLVDRVLACIVQHRVEFEVVRVLPVGRRLVAAALPAPVRAQRHPHCVVVLVHPRSAPARSWPWAAAARRRALCSGSSRGRQGTYTDEAQRRKQL